MMKFANFAVLMTQILLSKANQDSDHSCKLSVSKNHLKILNTITQITMASFSSSTKCNRLPASTIAESILSKDNLCVYNTLIKNGFNIECLGNISRRMKRYAVKNRRKRFLRMAYLAEQKSKYLKIIHDYIRLV